MSHSEKKWFTNWAPPGVMTDHYTNDHFVSPRPDGRFERSLGFIMHYIRNQKQQLSMDKLTGATEFPAWREQVRKKLRELMKMHENPTAEFVRLSAEQRDGYQLCRYEFYPEPGLAVPILLLIPDQVAASGKPAPAVICTPGSGASLDSLAGEPDNYINRYPMRNRQAWWYAQCGMIGVAVENPATGRNGEPGIEYGQTQLRFLELLAKSGRTYHGFVTEQQLMILEFLKKHPLVDPARLALSGLSLGCGGVLYTALISDDVAAAVYNDFVCSNDSRLLATTEIPSSSIPAASYLPGARDWFDIQPDLMAALAPKPLLLAEGGPWKWHLEKITRAYAWANAADKLAVHYYPKYADPAARRHDDVDLRTATGLNGQEYLDYSYVDASQHSFHADIALPWLCGLFFGSVDFPARLKAEIAAAVAEKEHKLT